MRVLSLALALLLVSGIALGGSDVPRPGSSLKEKELVELCDPNAAGAMQLYCRYYIMGLVDGLNITNGVCLPEGLSSEHIRRVIYASMAAEPKATELWAITAVRKALAQAFPCA